MTDPRDTLNEAVAARKKEQATGPPREFVDPTLEQLAKAAATAPQVQTKSRNPAPYGVFARRIWPAARLAAAESMLISVGFSIGKPARPGPLDLAPLHDALAPAIKASLEPAIREKLTMEMTQRYEAALANTYLRVREELTQHLDDELNR